MIETRTEEGRSLGNPALHMALSNMAARLSGADLAEARASGKLTVQGEAKIISRCRSCRIVGFCEAHLAVGLVPEACPNKAAFGELGLGAL